MDHWGKSRLRAVWIVVAAFGCSVATLTGTLAVMAANAATPIATGLGAHIMA